MWDLRKRKAHLMCKNISLSSSSIGSSWFNVCEFVIFIKKVYMWFLWKRKWRSMGDIFYNDNCWIIYAGSTWQNYHIIQGIMRTSVLLWNEYKEVKFTTFSIVLSDSPKKYCMVEIRKILYVNYYELTSCVRLCRIKLKFRVTNGAFIASKMS